MEAIDQIVHTKFSVSKGSPVPITVPILILIFAVGAFFNNVNFAIVLLLVFVAVMVFTLREKIETDLAAMEFKEGFSILGIWFGKTKKVSEPDYLLISKSVKSTKIYSKANVSADFNEILFDIDLITKGDRDVLIYRNYNRDKAIQFANEVASDYKIKVCEKSSEGYVWLS